MVVDPFKLEQNSNVVVAVVNVETLSSEMTLELTHLLRTRMRAHNANCFVIDLHKVEFMDSGCIGALVTLLQELNHVRGRIVLARCKPNVAFLFSVTRLDSVFAMYDEVKPAVADLIGGVE